MSRTLELWRREGLLRRPWESELVMEFVHPHLVEYFFEEADADLHLLVAATKEDAANDDGRQVDPASLARHYRAADDTERAIEYLERAGEGARERGNYARARRLYEELLPLVDGSVADRRKRDLAKRVNYALGELCLRLSEFGPSSDYFQRAQSLARADQDSRLDGLCYCGRADLALAQRQLDEADRYFHQARGLVDEGDREQQGRLLLGMGQVSGLKGDWEAAQSCFQRAYENGSAAKAHVLMARSLHELGRTAIELGNQRAAHEWFGQALKLFKEHGAAADESEVLLDIATTARTFRRTEDARGHIERAIEIEQRLGDRIGVARGLAALGELEAALLHIEEAQKFIVRALPIFKNHGDTEGEVRCKTTLAELDAFQGHYDKSRTLVEQAIEQISDTGRLSTQVLLAVRLGDVEVRLGRHQIARETVENAIMLLDAHGSDVHRGALQQVLGRIAEQHGDLGRAEAHYKNAYESATQAEWHEQQMRARVHIIRVNLFYQGGRWYYDELWEIVREARSYAQRRLQLEALLCLSWFEGVYGDQAGWERAINELTQHVSVHRIPGRGVIKELEFLSNAVEHLMPDQIEAYSQSAGWIRQTISATSMTSTAM